MKRKESDAFNENDDNNDNNANKESKFDDDDDTLDEKKPVNVDKLIRFCFGEHGIVPWRINKKCCGTFISMDWPVLTICIAPNCQHSDEVCNSRMPFNVSYDDVLCFLLFANCKCENFVVLSGTQEHHVLTASEVNFVVVARMFEFFQVGEKKDDKLLITFLSTQTSFKTAVSCLSAFHLVPTRLKHGLGTMFYNTRIMDVNTVLQALGLLMEDMVLLSHLHIKKCVIAGGGAMRLGCDWSKFTLRSDVDFFVFKSENQFEVVKNLVKALEQTGRRIYKTGLGVLSAIGKYGLRRIQVILTTAQTPEELTKEFDFPAVSAFYDGTCLHATVGAQYSWMTRKCITNVNYRRINAIRLLNMHWKGFKLNKEAIAYLENTVYGWPVDDSMRNLHEQAIPYLLPSDIIPQMVQDANLFKAFNMKAVFKDNNNNTEELQSIEEEEEDEDTRYDFIDEMTAFNPKNDMVSEYQHYENVFERSSLMEYIKTTCRVNAKPMDSKKGRATIHAISSDFVFQIAACHVFGTQTDGKKREHEADDEVTTKVKSVCIGIQNNDLLNDLQNTVLEHFCKQLELANGFKYTADDHVRMRLNNHFYAKYSKKTTQFFENGFPQSNLLANFVHPGKVLIRPAYLVIGAKSKDTIQLTLQWHCSSIFWTT